MRPRPGGSFPTEAPRKEARGGGAHPGLTMIKSVIFGTTTARTRQSLDTPVPYLFLSPKPTRGDMLSFATAFAL
jgi:hypothetical protein